MTWNYWALNALIKQLSGILKLWMHMSLTQSKYGLKKNMYDV